MFRTYEGRRTRAAGTRLMAVALATLLVSACTFRTGGVQALPPDDPPQKVESPTRAHLLDGSIVSYPNGFVREGDYLEGEGHTQNLLLEPIAHRARVPVSEVAALESFESGTDEALSLLVSAGGIAAGLYAGAYIFKAIFGSCPTIYSYADGTEILEAESFSYSIAPAFEAADLDRIGAVPDADGTLALEVRNEAPESHYINRLDVLRVAHDSDELAVAGGFGRAVVLRSPVPVPRARSLDGEDLTETLATADGEVYRSSVERLDAAIGGEYRDAIELTVPNPSRASRLGLAVRVRSSMLTTVLLYDVLLGNQGVHAIDWMGRDLKRIDRVAPLVAFNAREMGLRVEVLEGESYRTGATVLDDVGPIAWERVGMIVDVPAEETVHLRLSFITDMWRIDELLVSPDVREARPVPLTPTTVRDAFDQDRPDILAAVSAADGRYAKTVPGDRFEIRFTDAEPPPHATYFLSAQGYYTEWLRPEWLRRPFRPLNTEDPEALLLEALSKWRDQRDDLRARFDATRIPVR